MAETQAKRKMQVGSSLRSEKIRTYNYNQDRITDHRIGNTVHNLKSFLLGEEGLDTLIRQLLIVERRDRLLQAITCIDTMKAVTAVSRKFIYNKDEKEAGKGRGQEKGKDKVEGELGKKEDERKEWWKWRWESKKRWKRKRTRRKKKEVERKRMSIRRSGKSTTHTCVEGDWKTIWEKPPDRDSNLDFPVLGSLAQHET
ncbi:unnamed protein product, partial [Timema podura]|nr:unnamed protein product [Timema podura]